MASANPKIGIILAYENILVVQDINNTPMSNLDPH